MKKLFLMCVLPALLVSCGAKNTSSGDTAGSYSPTQVSEAVFKSEIASKTGVAPKTNCEAVYYLKVKGVQAKAINDTFEDDFENEQANVHSQFVWNVSMGNYQLKSGSTKPNYVQDPQRLTLNVLNSYLSYVNANFDTLTIKYIVNPYRVIVSGSKTVTEENTSTVEGNTITTYVTSKAVYYATYNYDDNFNLIDYDLSLHYGKTNISLFPNAPVIPGFQPIYLDPLSSYPHKLYFDHNGTFTYSD